MPDDDSLKNAINSFVMSLEEEARPSKKVHQTPQEEADPVKKDTRSKTINAGIQEKDTDSFKKIIEITKKIIEKICGEENLIIEHDISKSRISVYGKDLSIAIGKNGKNIDAVEYIVNLISKRKRLSDNRILVDIKDYRKKNSEKIKKLALRMAEKAVKEGRKISLKPMPPQERKAVHNLLSKIKDVKTRSRDDEPNRRIVIYPVERKSK